MKKTYKIAFEVFTIVLAAGIVLEILNKNFNGAVSKHNDLHIVKKIRKGYN